MSKNTGHSLQHRVRYGIGILAMLLLPTAATAQSTEPITVYTVTGLPVSVPWELAGNTTVIHLDRARIIEEELARGIHALAPETRLEAVRGRFTPSVQQEVVRLWQALGWETVKLSAFHRRISIPPMAVSMSGPDRSPPRKG